MPEFAFRNALESATVLNNMADYLNTIAAAVSTGNNPFLNK